MRKFLIRWWWTANYEVDNYTRMVQTFHGSSMEEMFKATLCLMGDGRLISLYQSIEEKRNPRGRPASQAVL